MIKVLTVLFSISGLLYLQISPAYARNAYEGKEAADKQKEEDSKSGQKETEKNLDELKEEGNKINSESDDVKVTEASEDTASIVLTVLFLLVIMITAPIFVITCPKPDTVLHAIAGVITIVLEGVFWGLYERGSTKALEIFEKTSKEGYDAQVTSMKTAMEITQKAKTWMDAKFGVQIAIGVMIAIAMAIVLIMSIIQTVRSLGVEAPIAQNCQTAYNEGPFKSFDSSKLYTSNYSTFERYMTRFETINRLSDCENLGELAFVNNEIERFSNGEIRSVPIADYDIIQKDKEINSFIEENKPIVSQFKEIIKNVSLFPTAVSATTTTPSSSTETGDKSLNAADIGSKLSAIGIGLAGGIITAIVAKVQTTLNIGRVNGWVRAGIYAAEIIFVGVVAGFTKKTADALGKRAEKYEELYKKLSTIMANQVGKGPGGTTPIPPQQIFSGASSQAIEEMNGHCFTDDASGGAAPNANCDCKATKTCKRANVPAMKFPNFKTPAVLVSSSKTAGTMGNQIFSGDMKGATVSADALGRNAVAIKDMNQKLMDLANKKLTELGKPSINFAQNQAKIMKDLKDAMRSTWGSLSPAQKNEAINAVMGRGGGEKKETTESTVAAVSPGNSGADSSAKGKKKSIFDLISDDKEMKTKLGKTEEKEGKDLDAYEDSSKQITEGSEKNLFKIIEIRYMKTAFPIFFEKNEGTN